MSTPVWLNVAASTYRVSVCRREDPSLIIISFKLETGAEAGSKDK